MLAQRLGPTKGLRATRRFALARSSSTNSLVPLHAEAGLDLRVGLKSFLKAA
jgi:hypothetical protein